MPDVINSTEFKAGNKYADYNPKFDKKATYGIAALVAGGILAKAGFFKLLLAGIAASYKFIIAGIVAFFAFANKLLKRKKSEQKLNVEEKVKKN